MVACISCRQRKRRCDGESPCETCRKKGQECIYQEPGVQKNDTRDGPEALMHRLKAVETLLAEHAHEIEALKRQQQQQQQNQNQNRSQSTLSGLTTVPVPDLSHARAESTGDDNVNMMPHSTWTLTTHNGGGLSRQGVDDDEVPPITIPLGHQTSTSSLLALPQLRSLLGDFPEEYFFRVEERRPRAAALEFITVPPSPCQDINEQQQRHLIDRAVADDYLQSFLAVVHHFHPIFDRDYLLASYEQVMEEGLGLDNKSAVFLAIFALGATASDPIDRSEQGNSGKCFMQRAQRILFASWTTSFSGDILISQGLILCALYFTYTVEPLTAWRLIHMASTSLQQLLIRCTDILSGEAEIQELLRISWVCFIIECDILAEFHQPRSGIDLLVDRMPFPNYGTSPKPESLYVLAEISIRSLLNRVHHAIYFTDSLTIYAGRALDSLSASRSTPPHPDASLLRVCGELNRQLEEWYEFLPEAIKPDLAGRTRGSRQACLLRLRYWSAKQSIWRPFVIYATSSQFAEREVAVPKSVLEKCEACLAACRAFLMAAEHLLSGRSPYTYSSAQFCFNCILVLALAATSLQLESLVGDLCTLYDLTVKLLKPWARSGSSIERAFEIASSIAEKQRLCDQRKPGM